jgi:hypothetical protein
MRMDTQHRQDSKKATECYGGSYLSIHPSLKRNEFLAAVTLETFQRYLIAVNTWSKGRLIYSTRDGYLGRVPVGAAVGDNICLFKGANVLYVPRLMGEEFALIGEAYIHGLM